MNKKFARILLALAFVLAVVTAPRAPQAATTTQPPAEDRVALYQALLDLQNPWTVMCVAAHPDDEDGTSLIVMRHKYGAHTVSLFSTFGEGGQNAIGPELYEELGAIRARETMAAAEIQGSEPHFLGLKDFGFSKTRDEAFKFWGHQEALRRMVLEIRKLRPDVIITNHSTASNDHGQHQATALMVVEAFDAAADPTKFPEQLKDGVTTWQVQRLFVRQRGNQAQQNPDRPGGGAQIVTIDPNEQDPVRGTVFGEQALSALQKHATQGPWPKSFEEYRNRFRAFSGQNAPTGQLPMIRYALVKTANSAAPMPGQESHNFLDGLQLRGQMAQELSAPTINGRPLTDFLGDRDRVLAALMQANRSGAAADSERGHASREFKCFGDPGTVVHDLDPKRDLFLERLATAIRESSGIKAQLAARDGGSAVVETEPFVLRVFNNGSMPVELKRVPVNYCAQVQIGPGEPPISGTLAPGQSITVPISLRSLGVLEDSRVAVWYSDVRLPRIFQREAIRLEVTLADNRVSLPVDSQLTFRPDVAITNITPGTAFGISTARGTKAKFAMKVTNNLSRRFEGRIAACLTEDAVQRTHYFAVLNTKQIALAPHETRQVAMELPESETEYRDDNETHTLSFPYKVEFRPQEEGKGEPRWYDIGTSDPVTINAAPVKVAPTLRVGYVRGFDYSLSDALASLGVESKELSVDDVKSGDLSKFTSVIVDNRVYESKPELIAANQKLLDYAQAGGNLIVFYHKSDEWNPDERRNRPQLAPYKLILGGERVTDENAPITFLEPDHPLLNTPNKMGQDDFKDWIQERGLYYPKEWDPQFHALLQSNDPGEQPLKGGLLVADYGKGHYIYTSMVWYRELRGGIPGAYRMLANMISYGR
jgi:LmbE family N-acetylglucosaminyl deacetylase